MAFFKTFGKNPAPEQIRTSPQYKGNQFVNASPTVLMTGKKPMIRNLWKFLNKPSNTVPPSRLPSVKTNLHALNNDTPTIVWFGHSSYLINFRGINILVDPVFSGHASPFNIGVKNFPGSDVYTVEDLPAIDILLLTHDHYDHLDEKTVIQLRSRVTHVCASRGVGSHLVFWGYDRQLIHEFDWWDSWSFTKSIRVTAAPARHFSGRSFHRNQTLWASYVLELDQYRIYAGGDSGYDSHFTEIGKRFGPFDLAILETGQYNTDWSQIHMMPEEAVQASIELQAKWMLPVHWAKFSLAFHTWSEPPERVTKKARQLGVQVTTPRIGEPVVIDKQYPQAEWWKLK